jgi:hypothetical protein
VKLRATLIGVFAALVAAVVTLTAAEGVLRLFAPQLLVTSAGLYESDAQRGYRLKAGFRGETSWGSEVRYRLAINDRSERGGDIDAHADCRLLALGDSHTFGPGVDEEDTYPARLEALLRERTGRRIEILNAGVPGYGWLEESETLRELIAGGLRIDLVLLQMSWNDVYDNAMGIPKYLIDGQGHLIVRQHRRRPGGFGEWGMKTAPIGALELAALRHSHVGALLIGAWRGAWYRLRREQIEQEINHYMWQVSGEVLATIADQLRAGHLDALAVIHPGDTPDLLETHRAMSDRVIAMLRDHDVVRVDLREPLRSEVNLSRLFIPGNEHFNARGYDWMSRQLLEPVLSRLQAGASRCLAGDTSP